ncbi:unnamed protein product [Nippostrongylus brasiliensis]|uniref:CASPASE_P20 domain-containing protein n=1 Tax=Nippostrongylus brasiliensis TaxID=27835 RepID=A0A0N4XEY6_NIPBR|nr:unnamed protein product [Nippostrongylus brasiliensis]
MDTSVRWKRDRLDFVHNQTRQCKKDKERKSEVIRNSTGIPTEDGTCKKSSILLSVYSHHGVFSTMHPDVYMFIPTRIERLLKTHGYGAPMMYVVRTNVSIGILKWLFCDKYTQDDDDDDGNVEREYNGRTVEKMMMIE